MFESIRLVTLAVSTMAALAMAPPARSHPPLEMQGEVVFLPADTENENPPAYRMSAHTFAYSMKLHRQAPALRMAIYHVQFPSPVRTRYPENNTVHAEYYLPVRSEPVPGVIILDILGGDQTLSRLQATILASRGIAALFVQMPYYGPRRPVGKRVRLLMPSIRHTLGAVRQTVLDVRRAVAWLKDRQEIDRRRIGLLGTSLGSFLGGLSAEMEPSIRRVALLLGGGGLVDAFYDHPQAWLLRTVYELLGGSKEQLARTIAIADPLTFADRLKNRDVLLFGAKRDDIVPPQALVRFWEATGKPEIIWYDSTHEGAALYFIPAMVRIVRFFRTW